VPSLKYSNERGLILKNVVSCFLLPLSKQLDHGE